jgi:hypothetical protein
LPRARAGAKAVRSFNRSRDMLAIGVIALFIVILAGINVFEFGRID